MKQVTGLNDVDDDGLDEGMQHVVPLELEEQPDARNEEALREVHKEGRKEERKERRKEGRKRRKERRK